MIKSFNLLTLSALFLLFHSLNCFKMIDFSRERSYPTPLSNSPFLLPLLISLATQKNSPTRLQTPSSIYENYDYIIVGSGSAGSTVAARLSEIPCVNVLLLEAGKSPPIINDVPALAENFWKSDLNWHFKTTPQNHTGRLLKNRQIEWWIGKGFGGSSLLNIMLYVRGNMNNYNEWEAQGAKGWSYKDVLPYFKKMEDNENIFDKYHGNKGPITVERPDYNSEIKDPLFEAARKMGYKVVDVNGREQAGFYDYQATIRNQQRCSTAKGYLVPAEERTNLHILPNAFVHKISIENNTAIGVLFEVDGEMYNITARREVIMSAGATNSAQLLMLSGIGPRKELEKFKIPVKADLPVGENLQDHCAAIMAFELDPSIPSAMEKLTDCRNTLSYISKREGILTAPFLISAMAFLNGTTANQTEDNPNFELYFQETSLKGSKPKFGMTELAYKQVFGPYSNAPVYTCNSQILQPKSRGYVKLQSADPHTPPLINPNYFSEPGDIDDVVEGLKVCKKIGTSKELQKVGSKPLNTLYPGCEKFKNDEDKYFRCQAQSVVVSISHQVGTSKMGDPRDPSTVVDPQLRVKSIKNLRVVDASIMPIIPSGNTNAPTIMVAEKAADMIKQDISCLSEENH